MHIYIVGGMDAYMTTSGSQNCRIEDIGCGVSVLTSAEHGFGTDAFLLSYFAAPRKSDIACDLCSGCGIIPLLWLRDRGAVKKAYSVDIQENAHALIVESARISGLGDVYTPVCADLKERGALPSGEFTLVTCNPPYNAANTGILSQSTPERIARHEIMCTINDVCEAAKRLLKFGGRLCVCHLPERLVDVLVAMRENNIEPKRLRFVQKRPDTAPWLVLVEGKLGSKPFLKVEPPFFTHNEDGKDSPEMEKLYRHWRRSQ